MGRAIPKDKQIEEKLTAEQVRVMRHCGTEPPGTGKWLHHDEPGAYLCAACGAELFRSEAKFDSGTGWPSFDRAADEAGLELLADDGGGMRRDEVRCGRCDSHLGHLFGDGPTATGKRYCINSVALDFRGRP